MKPALFLLGLFITIISHPKIRGPVVSRMINEGVITQKNISRDEAEVIKYAGPNLSLFFIGIVLMIISLIL